VLMWAQTRTTPRWADMRPILLFACVFSHQLTMKIHVGVWPELGKNQRVTAATCKLYFLLTTHCA
jgi:hypothetical protein